MTKSLTGALMLFVLGSPIVAAGLLPSQTDPRIYTAKICQNPEILSLIIGYAQRILKSSKLVIDADDVHLEAVFPAKNLVGCSILISTATAAEAVHYVVGPEGNSFKIVIGGEHSELFPSAGTIRP